jgi:hypothetical protein
VPEQAGAPSSRSKVEIPAPHGPAPTSTHCVTTKMYVAGIMDHFSDAPKMELIVWGSTMGILASSVLKTRSQLKRARSRAGGPKPSSTGPRIWTGLALLGQFGGLTISPLVYWTATAYNKFHQPEWMTEYALPPLPDVFGVDGVTVGRAVGLLVLFAGTAFTRTALKALGDQFHAIRVSDLFLVDYQIPTGSLHLSEL